jgi:3-mercaptopyruvate sulfurtransferase SseA
MATSTRRLSIPIVIIALGVLLILGAVFLFSLNQEKERSTTANPAIQEEQITGIPRVSLEEAKAAYDTKEAVFVDVRDSAAYQENHIPGAVSIPLTELEARIGELDPNDWIIAYCT